MKIIPVGALFPSYVGAFLNLVSSNRHVSHASHPLTCCNYRFHSRLHLTSLLGRKFLGTISAECRRTSWALSNPCNIDMWMVGLQKFQSWGFVYTELTTKHSGRQ
ncbi:uncharacterized protein BT62DRAFT_465827 [Guyanagaster necrorhizus]|uniref:Uncharacterized protein n=1 Tax=Guyanagaster necrorhizus TaxID=856835 RepID=A0A9P7VIR2_9AGAR|nr:uncharacterized protein BT62DRAFT_465827 [Guyanagaster necrorhizus MCA 3950]KAG7441826.1 hypothetical protein BT62DRAFT_465827 [Guyanagaster necrorhizus MCA 3950]